MGTTMVTCTATDLRVNRANCRFRVTVNPRPEQSAASGGLSKMAVGDASNDMVVAASGCQALIPDLRGRSMASDTCAAKGSQIIDQRPAPQTVVGPGKHPITVTVMDEAGNRISCTITFTVLDTTSPTITTPGDITVNSDAGRNGAVVTFNVTARDDCQPDQPVVCTPASGSFFPVGTTQVTCTATDEAGNSATGSFEVNVNPRSNRLAYASDVSQLSVGGDHDWPLPSGPDGQSVRARVTSSHREKAFVE
jgi:hypothetical protein